MEKDTEQRRAEIREEISDQTGVDDEQQDAEGHEPLPGLVDKPDQGRRRAGRGGLAACELAEPAASHRLEQRVARRALVVPGEGHLTHQVRVRGLQPGVPFEHLAEPHHAPLAANAADLDRLLAQHAAQAIDRSTRSAAAS
jgi:hypothetical protein